jgi:hypothetical protein
VAIELIDEALDGLGALGRESLAHSAQHARDLLPLLLLGAQRHGVSAPLPAALIPGSAEDCANLFPKGVP